MVKDAEAHAREDKERREQVEARNQLDSLVYSTEKTYDEHKEKLGPDEKGSSSGRSPTPGRRWKGEPSAADGSAPPSASPRRRTSWPR